MVLSGDLDSDVVCFSMILVLLCLGMLYMHAYVELVCLQHAGVSMDLLEVSRVST